MIETVMIALLITLVVLIVWLRIALDKNNELYDALNKAHQLRRKSEDAAMHWKRGYDEIEEASIASRKRSTALCESKDKLIRTLKEQVVDVVSKAKQGYVFTTEVEVHLNLVRRDVVFTPKQLDMLGAEEINHHVQAGALELARDVVRNTSTVNVRIDKTNGNRIYELAILTGSPKMPNGN